jgi:hypothetical protein
MTRKKQRGQPELYDEVKKRVTIALTPTGDKRLSELASIFDLSKSEFVEQLARGVIPILTPDLALQLGKSWNTSSP